MQPLYSNTITTDLGEKEIAVFCSDALRFDKRIDILTTSAASGSYHPSPGTLFEAFYNMGVSVDELAGNPQIDIRRFGNTWLSNKLNSPYLNIGRIGCVELLNVWLLGKQKDEIEQSLINSVKTYFAMLDIAAIGGVEMETIALPLLGSGNQGLSARLMIVPIVNECIAFLKRNASVKRIYFIERNITKAEFIADYLSRSYNLSVHKVKPMNPENNAFQKAYAFISYSSKDKNIADNLCAKLEQNGVSVWYAPRDVNGPYAASITKGIERATHFIVILSQNSIQSQHVLNEIDLAFQKLPNKIKFKPLRIDEAEFDPSFKYYLSRQHWMDASYPPIEDRLNEFVRDLIADI